MVCKGTAGSHHELGREFLKAVPLILAGERLPRYSDLYGGIDAFNALTQERTRARTVPEVRSDLTSTHTLLLETLSAMPVQIPRVEARLRRRLKQDTYLHYREHVSQIVRKM